METKILTILLIFFLLIFIFIVAYALGLIPIDEAEITNLASTNNDLHKISYNGDFTYGVKPATMFLYKSS